MCLLRTFRQQGGFRCQSRSFGCLNCPFPTFQSKSVFLTKPKHESHLSYFPPPSPLVSSFIQTDNQPLAAPPVPPLSIWWRHCFTSESSGQPEPLAGEPSLQHIQKKNSPYTSMVMTGVSKYGLSICTLTTVAWALRLVDPLMSQK